MHKGRLLDPAMRRERVTREEVLAALRARGFGSIDDIDSVVLETDGSLSVLEDMKGASTVPIGVDLAVDESR